jgi:hypothetical protein
MNLEDYSEIELMTAWLKKVDANNKMQMTRLGRTEVRHVCLYAGQSLSELRTLVLNDSCNSGHVILELKGVITDLEGLVGYLKGEKGSFSALVDRNK